MTINKSKEGNKTVISLKGRLDTNTASQLEREIESLDKSEKDVTFDLKELVYMSSAGLRVMLGSYKKLKSIGGNLVIKNANEDIIEVFEITGFVDVLNIEN